MNDIIQTLNPDCIESFTSDGKCLELRFKDATVLKARSAACVLSTGGKLLVGRELVFPEAVCKGGSPIADGKPRCVKCDCILDMNNKIDGHCWECVMKLPAVVDTIMAMEILRVPNREKRVRETLTRLNPENPAKLTTEYLLNETMKGMEV